MMDKLARAAPLGTRQLFSCETTNWIENEVFFSASGEAEFDTTISATVSRQEDEMCTVLVLKHPLLYEGINLNVIHSFLKYVKEGVQKKREERLKEIEFRIEELIKNGAFSNSEETMMMIACRPILMQAFLTRNKNLSDFYKRELLEYAVEANNYATVELLLPVCSGLENCAIRHALAEGERDMALFIIEKANPSNLLINVKAFKTAVAYKDEEVIQKLIDKGVDVNQRDHSGLTTFQHGIIHDDIDGSILLLQYGARVDLNHSDVRHYLPIHDRKGLLSKLIRVAIKKSSAGNKITKKARYT